MHPAKSVIFFTTASGAGYGLIVWLGMFSAFAMLPADQQLGVVGVGLALFLIVSGLLSSTLHLGHPERAWRALSQWRSSWLSREGVAAIASFAPIIAFGYCWVILGRNTGLPGAIGVMAALVSLATVYCTAMIYASLKAIPAWSNQWTPIVYLILSLTTGGTIFVLLSAFMAPAITQFMAAMVTMLLAASLILKFLYWRSIDNAPATSTAESATGLGKFGAVRLIEAPHSQSNYLMDEMGFVIARKHASALRKITLICGFIIPAMLMTLISAGGPLPVAASILACFLVGIGISVERWLFFAEARHAVTLYYGETSV